MRLRIGLLIATLTALTTVMVVAQIRSAQDSDCVEGREFTQPAADPSLSTAEARSLRAALKEMDFYEVSRPSRVVARIERNLRRKAQVSVLTDQEVSTLVNGADVVLLSDYHLLPYLEKIFADRILEWGKGRHVALYLEAVRVSSQAGLLRTVHTASDGRGEDLLSLLQREWPFPVKGYTSHLPDLYRAGVILRAAGYGEAGESREGGRDCDRVPRELKHITRAEWLESQHKVLNLVDSWLDRAGPRRRLAFVQFGQTHLLDPQAGLMRLFQAQGWKVVCVEPFAPLWSRALYERCGGQCLSKWCVVEEGVLLAPDLVRAMTQQGLSMQELREYPGDAAR